MPIETNLLRSSFSPTSRPVSLRVTQGGVLSKRRESPDGPRGREPNICTGAQSNHCTRLPGGLRSELEFLKFPDPSEPGDQATPAVLYVCLMSKNIYKAVNYSTLQFQRWTDMANMSICMCACVNVCVLAQREAVGGVGWGWKEDTDPG